MPLSFITSFLRLGGLAARFNSVLRSFRKCDYVVDIGGITFSEDRGLSGLLINATWTLLALFSGKPLIKLSQAFGPIRKRWFRFVSHFLLDRIQCLIARGNLSRQELDTLNLQGEIFECADLAFLLPTEESDKTRELMKPKDRILLGIAPSSVLYSKLGGLPYLHLMANIIENMLLEYSCATIWLYAHSFREEKTYSNNDGPICRKIFNALSETAQSKTKLVMGDYSPSEMRALVSRSDVFLACRFHAMVSALVAGVPTAVLDWSHKYREVQMQFGIDYCIDYKKSTVASICSTLSSLIDKREDVTEIIQSRLSGVIASSLDNFRILGLFVNKYREENSL